MNNHEYIIASLPVIQQGEKALQNLDSAEIIAEIRSQCSASDNALLDIFLAPEDDLSDHFYHLAAKCRNTFIREYFKYDLEVRNAKVAFLNKELGRDPQQDMVIMNPEAEGYEFEDADKVKDILETKDILARERGLDDLMWNKIEELNQFNTFEVDVILGFLGKLKIVDRWLKLDPETGRKRFRELVDEIRKTE